MDTNSPDGNECEPGEWRLDAILASVLVNLAELTTCQHAVLREFVREPNDRRIARALGISPQTVRNHLSRIQKKLKVNSRAELMKVAIASAVHDAGGELG